MKPQIFIDGREGTTGLQIYDRLANRNDIELITIDAEKRKDTQARQECLNSADLAFLCLPDGPAREAVSLVTNPNTKIIDASTAHRTNPQWVYGFPELSGLREKIETTSRLANPGCHATGFLCLVAPLVELGVLPHDYPLTCHSITGYSGGGKSLIAEYEADNRPHSLNAPTIYATQLQHKHLPEMQSVAKLSFAPIFSPILADIYKGMATSIMIHNHLLPTKPTALTIHQILSDYYQNSKLIHVMPFEETTQNLSANALSGTDRLDIVVSGHNDQTMLTALFDNLGKGASGASVQNMNLMLGFDELTGLKLV